MRKVVLAAQLVLGNATLAGTLPYIMPIRLAWRL